MTTRLKFPALVPDQARNAKVAFFISTAGEIARIARIDRLSRTEDGTPSGFQRPQISGHIREIGDYLARPDAILANPIVLGFVGGATIKKSKTGTRELTVDIRSEEHTSELQSLMSISHTVFCLKTKEHNINHNQYTQ